MKHLRYGNLVDTPYAIGAVTAYNKNSIHVEIDGDEKLVMMSEVKDIAITEEWLKKLGFKKVDNYFSKVDSDLTLAEVLSENCFYIGLEFRHLTPISTISQLQNIYFDIEGVELW